MAVVPANYPNAGVDYLTCTYNPQANHTRLLFYLGACEREELDRGGLSRRWGMAGYIGAHAGGLEWGSKSDGVIVRLSGETARSWWAKFGKLASNCSRIDLQQTVVYDEPPHRTINRHFKELRKWNKTHRKPMTAKLWCGDQGAEAMFSGKRVSDSYLRCYHRGSKPECSHEQGHLRYEVELKNSRARQALQGLLASDNPEAVTRATVGQMFSARGVRLTWQEGCTLTFVTPIKNDDAGKRLRWLRDAIRPAVQNLIEHGYRDEVVEALGLMDQAQADKDWSN